MLKYNYFILIKYLPNCEDFPKEIKCNWTFLEQQRHNQVDKAFASI